MMNRLIFASLALAVATTAFAQPTAGDRAARGEQRIERQAERMADSLDLTAAQTLEIRAIFAEQAAARHELHQRFREENQALREQGDARLATVLNAGQMAKFEQMRIERKGKWRGKRHGHRHGKAGG